MASNPTPNRIEELIAAGEDLADGIQQHEAALGIKQNTEAVFRNDLETLKGRQADFKLSDSVKPIAYAQLRTADSNAKGFIARAIKVLSISLGNRWSDAWLATGLPNQTVGVPGNQDDRFTALGGLKNYFALHPQHESPAPPISVSAAIATTLHDALSAGRNTVANALSNTATAVAARDAAEAAFRVRYRGAVDELGQLLGDDDPRWYDFGLNRPSDESTPGQVSNVLVTPGLPGTVVVHWDGARRADSFNVYRQSATDPAPVKVAHVTDTTALVEGLAPGSVQTMTVRGSNPAGEGPASTPIQITVP